MTCRELQPLLSIHAAGALAEVEAAAVEAHVAGCAACRAELARDAEVLGLAALPPVGEAEQAALSDLPARTLGALRTRSARRLRLRKLVTVGAIAAAALLVLALPALDHLRSPAAPAEGWREPDLAGLWSDSGVLTAAADPAQQAYDDDALTTLDWADDE